MKTFVVSLIAAALLALGVIAAACGGGDELTLEEYFEQAQVISDESDEEFEALYAVFPEEDDDEEFFSNEENLTVIKDFAAGFPVIFRDTLNDVEALDPPAEVEDAHDEFLAAGRDLVKLYEGLTSPIEEAESISEAEELFGHGEDDPEIEAADRRFTAACLALAGIAEDNGIVLDLECEDEE